MDEEDLSSRRPGLPADATVQDFEVHLVAVSVLLGDVLRIIHANAPAATEQLLRHVRLQAQLSETGRRSQWDLDVHRKIRDLLEDALGRTAADLAPAPPEGRDR